ncbi:MAG: hypothetical protein M5R40_29990 [Anaerolineae bacterium]|nr:hypothetical protein [Anaerolineae bacterium]
MANPYAGLISFWHWQGKAIGENTIDEVIATIKGWAPHARGVWVKTSNGTVWQGVFDTKPDLAINGPQDIERWVSKLENNGMEFHAWCVPKGRTETLDAEANLIIQACPSAGRALDDPRCRALRVLLGRAKSERAQADGEGARPGAGDLPHRPLDGPTAPPQARDFPRRVDAVCR